MNETFDIETLKACPVGGWVRFPFEVPAQRISRETLAMCCFLHDLPVRYVPAEHLIFAFPATLKGTVYIIFAPGGMP